MNCSDESRGYYDKFNKQLKELEAKWERRSTRRRHAGPSKQNWRFEKKLKISPHNTSAEKTLEKAIAAQAGPDWANQVPTASGLFNSTGDKLRNVDLVRRCGNAEYEFIELKVNSDTPLYALDEVNAYGIYYVFSRIHYPSSYFYEKELLRANKIHLVVLAPRHFYPGFKLSSTALPVNEAWKRFLDCTPLRNLDIDFAFHAFPEHFRWPNDRNEFIAALNDRAPLA